MKLSLNKVVNGARLGVINNLGKNGDKILELPGCLLYTKTGSPPHLTHDTLQTIEGVPPVAHITLSSLAEHQEVLEEYKEGIAKFAGMPDTVLYCSVNDPVTPNPAGYNTNKTVSVWGGGGRLELTSQKFMAAQRALRADWFQCLSDGEVMTADNSKKRAKKSVDRSLVFLDECLQLLAQSEVLKQSVVIGAIEGGDVLEERLRSARETAKRPVGGFLLDGFQGSAMSRETKLSLISSITAALPEDKPRFMHGVGRPDELLDCIERGVDLFDCSFPYEVTERGCALSFKHCYNPDPETAVLDESETREEESNGNVVTEDPEIDRSGMTSFEICLKEKRFREDFKPLLQGCTCYCCRNHTRAYVHHLLMSKELLAGILLMIHNFQLYFSFFRSVRDALRDGKLSVLSEIIQRQASWSRFSRDKLFEDDIPETS
ncbi:queuine tRNA-ribosyltransferase accessory subunit 2 isoform X1 [Pelobates cultripes]|uniref:Queuine tRNA-ribosyltransferase accessory subunit 2 n=1 Tax=Pelobates cultripes TaxID=61616 RepID=A0AAD1QX84_PELCU|nr:queuine tRNA-ribosyltransferase accessory subunit 2 isoform X1 [Pelobates cultripes]